MFNFVEQPVTIRNYDYALSQQRPTRLVVQNGIQPVAFVEQDICAMERPQSLLGSVFSFHKRKG